MKAIVILSWLALCVASFAWFFHHGRGKPEVIVATPPPPVAVPPDDPDPEPVPEMVPRELTALELAAAGNFPSNLSRDRDRDGITERLTEAAMGTGMRVDPAALLLGEELQEDDFPAALQKVLNLPEPGRKEILHAVLARWAVFEPDQAFQFAAEQFPNFERLDGLSTVLGSWAAVDGEAALSAVHDWIDSESRTNHLKPKLPKDSYTLMKPLFFGWAKSDLAAAASSAQGLTRSYEIYSAWNGIGAAAGLQGKRDEALRLAETLSDETTGRRGLKPRWIAVAEILDPWAIDDPAAAAAWVDEHGYGTMDNGFFWHPWWRVARRYLDADRAAGAEWMTNSIAGDSEDRRESAQNTAIMSWAPVDIEAAAAWLDRVGPYDDSVLSLAEQYVPVDLEKSVAWARRASEGTRDEVVAKVLAKALRHHAPEVLVPYLGAGNLSPEAMAKKIGMTQPGTVSAFD